MDISIIVGLVTIWLTILGFMLTLVNGQRELRKDFKEETREIKKDLEEKISKSEESIREETRESKKYLEEKIDSIKDETREIKEENKEFRREIASLYRLLISQGRHYEDPEDKKVA